MKLTKTICDVCNLKTSNEAVNIQVIFTTEQNEGKPCAPYLQSEKLDLCNNCLNKVLHDGYYIFAEGAMGSNKYFFKNRKYIYCENIATGERVVVGEVIE